MLKEQITQLTTEAIRAGEMRQGCTNHSYYAEILTNQIIDLIERDSGNMDINRLGAGYVATEPLREERE